MNAAPRRRLPPEVRRAQIAAVTQELVSERGYWGITMADIAKAAGVTVQGVLHHFPSKDDIMLEVLTRRDVDDIQSVVDDNHPVRDVFDFIFVIERLVARNAARPQLIRMYSILNAESLNPDHPAHEYFDQRFRRGVDTFAELATPWHPDPHEVGVKVIALLDGLQLASLRDPKVDPVREWHDWAHQYFQVRDASNRVPGIAG
jgi:AcrR family transcriptional regulator